MEITACLASPTMHPVSMNTLKRSLNGIRYEGSIATADKRPFLLLRKETGHEHCQSRQQ